MKASPHGSHITAGMGRNGSRWVVQMPPSPGRAGMVAALLTACPSGQSSAQWRVSSVGVGEPSLKICLMRIYFLKALPLSWCEEAAGTRECTWKTPVVAAIWGAGFISSLDSLSGTPSCFRE